MSFLQFAHLCLALRIDSPLSSSSVIQDNPTPILGHPRGPALQDCLDFRAISSDVEMPQSLKGRVFDGFDWACNVSKYSRIIKSCIISLKISAKLCRNSKAPLHPYLLLSSLFQTTNLTAFQFLHHRDQGTRRRRAIHYCRRFGFHLHQRSRTSVSRVGSGNVVLVAVAGVWKRKGKTILVVLLLVL